MKTFVARLGACVLAFSVAALTGACDDDETSSPTTTTTATSGSGAGGAGGDGTGGATTQGGGGSVGVGGQGGEGGMAPFSLSIPGFSGGDTYPAKYECPTCNNGGMNLSPELAWTAGPAGTMSYAIVMRDLDFMSGFIHWVMWDIPATEMSLGEGIPEGFMPGAPAPAGAKQAPFNNQLDGYLGMCSCNSVNTYQFTIYAIPTATLADLDASSSKEEAEAAIVAAALASTAVEGES